MVNAEIITKMCTITEPCFHEHIADALLVLGGRQWLRAAHSGVTITTYRHVIGGAISAL